MAKIRETRHRRTRSDLGETRGPQERTEIVSRPASAMRRSADDFALLSTSFGRFFEGVQKAAEVMLEAEKRDRENQIKIENKRQEFQGIADAEAGKQAALPNDLDYMTAYARTKGVNVGQRAATDFIAQLESQPAGTDPEAFRERFFQSQIGEGTGDPVHDAAMFSTFKNRTDEAVLGFRVNSAKKQRQAGIDALAEEVYSKADAAGIDDLRDWIARSTELNLGDEMKGRTQVLSALKQAATTPRALQKLNSLLHAPGYFADGREKSSFADAFPLSAQEFSETATKQYLSALSAEAFEKYAGIEARLRDPDVMNDEMRLLDLIYETSAVRDQHGGESVHDQLVGKMQTQLDKIIAAKAEYNGFILKGLHGGYPVDQQQINKHLPRVMSERLALQVGEGMTPLSSPAAAEEAARVVNTYHAIDTDLRATMSAALQDAKNPNVQANSWRFFAKLRAEGQDPAQYMTGDAYKQFVAIDTLMRTTANGNLETAIAALNGNPNLAKEVAKEVEWPVLMGRPGDTREKVVTDVASEIRENLAETLGVTRFFGLMDAPGRITMMPDVQQELLSDYAQTLKVYQASGIPGAQKAAMEAVTKGLAANYLTIPGADGAVQIVRKRDYPAFNETNRVGPGYAFNPATGERESTLEVFRRDMESAKRNLPGLFGSPELFYVQRGRGNVREDGSFLLMNGEERVPVMFAPGQQIALEAPDGAFTKALKKTFGARTTDGKFATLSNDPAEAQRDLEAILPKHFKVERQDTIHGTVFRVFYQFHVTEPEDLASLAARYKRGKPGPDPQAAKALQSFGIKVKQENR